MVAGNRSKKQVSISALKNYGNEVDQNTYKFLPLRSFLCRDQGGNCKALNPAETGFTSLRGQYSLQPIT